MTLHHLFFSLMLPYTRRLVVERYRGSVLGIGWALLTPLLMLLIYTFVFSTVFQPRWHRAEDGILTYAMVIFAGLALHSALMEMLSRSTGIILQNPNFVTKIVFPLPVLVPCHLLATLVPLVISIGLIFIAGLLTQFYLPFSTFMTPLILLPFILMLLGLGWMASALSVYIRDIPNILPALGSVLLFTSSIFYPPDALPLWLRWCVYVNPLTVPVEWLRHVLFHTPAPDVSLCILYSVSSIGICILGYWLFRRLQPGFADVL